MIDMFIFGAVTVAAVVVLGVLLFVELAFNRPDRMKYPAPPAECPFWKGAAAGPLWSGSARAEAYFEVVLGYAEPRNLEAWWARQHPRYGEMVALHRLSLSPAPKVVQ